jgi:hypothetical protein
MIRTLERVLMLTRPDLEKKKSAFPSKNSLNLAMVDLDSTVQLKLANNTAHVHV